MADLNAKAPKVRSGDEINPVLAGIIKISALLVTAALIVVITLIVVKFIQRNKKEESIFEDKVHITLDDYNKITSKDGNYENISNNVIRDIVLDLSEEDGIYFYFYFKSLSKDLDKDLIETINKIKVNKDKEYHLFLVDLESDVSTDDSGKKQEPFLNHLKGTEELNDNDDINDLDFVLRKSNLEKNPSFVITFNKQLQAEFENPFRIIYKLDDIKQLVADMPVYTEEN